MGLKPNRVYLDSCLVIYLIEEHSIYAPALENYIAKTSDLIFVASHLTEMECLIMPFRKNNAALINKFNDWFEQAEIVALGREIFHQSARLRADFAALKTPDSLHLSAAVYHDCNEFWTNDNRLDKVNSTLVKNILTT